MYFAIAGYVIAFSLAVLGYCGIWLADFIKCKKKAKDEAFRRLCRKDIETRLDIKRNRIEFWKTVKK